MARLTDEEISQMSDEMLDKEIERCNLERERLKRCVRNLDILLYAVLVLFVFSFCGMIFAV